MKTDEHATFLGDIAHRQARTLPIRPVRPVYGWQQLSGSYAPDVPQTVFQDTLLDGNLRVRVEVLQAASSAYTEMRTRRFDSIRTCGLNRSHPRKIECALGAVDLDCDALSDQSSFDEDRLAIDTRDTATFLVECSDKHGVHAFFPEFVSYRLYRRAKRPRRVDVPPG